MGGDKQVNEAYVLSQESLVRMRGGDDMIAKDNWPA